MSSNQIGRRIRGISDTGYADVDTWPTPDEGAIKGDERTRYLSRKSGVRMYLAGFAEEEIRKKSGLGIKQIYRLITERCLQVHADGLIYGWRGLVPHIRIKPYTRKKHLKVTSFGYGASGAMKVVMDLHPELRESFNKRILKSPRPDELGATKRPRQAHWKWFLDQLRELGYEKRNDWPFSTESNGYSSVCRYIDRVLSENPKKAIRVIGGPDLEKKLISGDGVGRPIKNIFQRVEMDAHKLDGRFCVMMPQVTGGYLPKIVHRIWVIVILDIVSRAVLGYYLSMGREVSKEDVMRAIKMALTRWHRRKLAFSDVAYLDEAALPSGFSDKFLGVCWDETSVDGALAETCNHVRQSLEDVVGSELLSPERGFSSRRSKDDRPFIESFFRKLASQGFQRMSNTTGGKPKDKQGRNPESIAVTSQFQLEYAEELLDVLIANYNATPHTSLGHRSPLAYLQYVCSKSGDALRYADPDSVQGILSYRKKCRVRGGLEQGRRPFVNFDGGQYSNDILGQRFDLVGKHIWVINHLEDDARVAQSSTLDGQSLGILRASPPWHKMPHSLRVRRAINSAVRRRMFTIASGVDAVEVFLDFCEAQTDRKLPVHPAYLEARRILVQQAEASTGKSMVESAQERTSTDVDGKPIPDGHSSTGSNATLEKGSKPSKTLPSRRMAASD